MEDRIMSASKDTNIFDDLAETKTEQIAKNIKTRILALQAENFENIEDMSKKTGIPESTLASYMRGIRRPGIDKLIEIANAYDISIQWLVGLSEHRKTLLSYRDGADNLNYRYNLECNCVRIETVRPFFSSIHYGEKNNLFSYENFYKTYYPNIDNYIRMQNRREQLLKEGKITLEEIVSLRSLEGYLSSDKLPLSCQEELLLNVGKALTYNNYDLIFIDEYIYFNFEIIDNKVVCLELRLSDEMQEDRMRKMYIYLYSQTIIDDFREERKYLSKKVLKSITNSQLVELLLKTIPGGTEEVKGVFAKIREREKKLLELSSDW